MRKRAKAEASKQGQVCAARATLVGPPSIDAHMPNATFGWGYARWLTEYMACLGPPLLPTLPGLVDRINASSVLELGCGEAVALQEATALLERRQRARGASQASVCAAGINSLEHALKYAYDDNPAAMARARAEGSVMAGNASRTALVAAARRRHVQVLPGATPHLVHTDFRRPWPLASGSFDLLLSQSAIGKLKYPDLELPPVLDEALRVLSTGGVAHLDIINAAGAIEWRPFLPGHETDTGVAAELPDGWTRRPAGERLRSWLQQHALPCPYCRGDRCTPVEIALGVVSDAHESRRGPGIGIPCDRGDEPRLGARKRCAVSLYYGARRSSYLLLHTFRPAAAAPGLHSCETAAFASAVVGPALRLLNGSFGVDHDRGELMRVLQRRAAVLHEARAKGDGSPDDAFQLPRMLSDRRMWAEAFVTAIRTWVRTSSAWSKLRVFQYGDVAG